MTSKTGSLRRRFNLWNRGQFELQRILLRGARYRLLMAAILVLVVSLVAGAVIAQIDRGLSDPGEAIWWAFLRLTDPGYLGDDEGVARRGVSMVVTVLGYLLFMGLLIAILTQWLDETIGKLELGLTPIAVSHHVLILGWTDRTAAIVGGLLSTRDRVKRFLELRGARRLRIVILAERVDAATSQELRERLGPLWNDRQVLLRSGSPLRVDHLARVAFLDASVIVLPGADHWGQGHEALDAQSIKTLLSVSQSAGEMGAESLPLAVGAIFDSRRAVLASRAYAGSVQILATDHLVSRLIARGVRRPGLFEVVSALASINEGSAIFVRQLSQLTGRRFDDLHDAFPGAVVLGTVQPGAWRAALNPGPEKIVEADDFLVFLAPDYAACEPVETELRQAQAAAPTPASRPAAKVARRVLIVGWSQKLPAIVRELTQSETRSFEVDVMSSRPADWREQILSQHLDADLRGIVRHVEGDYTLPGEIEKLEPSAYDNIVLLASDRLASGAEADARTILGYLLLRDLLPEDGSGPRVLIELMDAENTSLFSRQHAEVIVSPTLASYLISQVALRGELGAVYDDLIGSSGSNLALYPVEEYVDGREGVRFDDIQRAVRARGEIALGLRRTAETDEAARGLTLNPDRETEWVIEPGDEVVVLTADGSGPSESPPS